MVDFVVVFVSEECLVLGELFSVGGGRVVWIMLVMVFGYFGVMDVESYLLNFK